MKISLLDIAPNPDKLDGNYYFDNFGEALIYALIGFLVVFLGIVLIICVIWLIGFILRKTNNLAFLTKLKIKKPKNNDKPEAVLSDNSEGELPDEVKAAITAAIMAYYCEEKPKCEFIVRRINRL